MGHRHYFWPGESPPMPAPPVVASNLSNPNDTLVNRKWKRELPFNPIKKPIVHKELLIYDLESKDEAYLCEPWITQRPGFVRPFMAGLLDTGDVYRAFFDENATRDDGDFRRRVVSHGGCIDNFCRHIFNTSDGGHFDPAYISEHAEFHAFNGGRFDATSLLVWLYLQQNSFSVSMTCVQGRIQSLNVTPQGLEPNDKHQITFLDSALIFPLMKLSKVTNLFSKGETKEADFDLATPEWEREKWIYYNRKDCVGLRDALHGYRDLLESEGGELAATAPASSMKLFRRKFMHESFDRAKHFPYCEGVCLGCTRGDECDGSCHGCLHEWIRKGYYGGRVEIFERFAPPPVYYYDRNSSYPASMKKPMPVGKPIAILGNEDFLQQRRHRADSGQLAFVEATVFIPDSCTLPPLPSVPKDGPGAGKLCFRAGTFHGVFEHDELSLLNDPFVNGRILHVDRSVWFKSKVIFSEFVDTLYAYKCRASVLKETLKIEGRDPTQEEQRIIAIGELAKIMLNSLYGKFAMNPERESLIFVAEGANWPTDPRAKPIDGRGGGHENCRIWSVPKYVDPSYVVPQWSARITALSRMAWWIEAKDIIMNGGRVLAGDTDALQTTIQMRLDVIHQTDLGMWKREYDKETFGRDMEDDEMLEFFGGDTEGGHAMFSAWKEKYGDGVAPAFVGLTSKFYALLAASGPKNDVIHMKGIPRFDTDGKTSLHTIETFRKMARGDELRKPLHRVSQPKTVLRQMQRGGPCGITMVDSVKRLRSVYDKRHVNDDGTTTPLVAYEGDESL